MTQPSDDTLDKIACPLCDDGFLNMVVDSRPAVRRGHTIIRRRRQCTGCGQRTTTIEIVEDIFNRLYETRTAKHAIVQQLVEVVEQEVREQMVRRLYGPTPEVLDDDAVIDEAKLRVVAPQKPVA